MIKINKKSYEKLIEQDISLLLPLYETPLYNKPELSHIIEILKDSVNWHYPEIEVEEKRKVVVYEWQRPSGKLQYEKVCIGNGIFHQFGSDYEEFESGPANYTTAIVELPDGSIINVRADLIVFNN